MRFLYPYTDAVTCTCIAPVLGPSRHLSKRGWLGTVHRHKDLLGQGVAQMWIEKGNRFELVFAT